MLEVFFDAHVLVHYEFTPEGRTINKDSTSKPSVTSGCSEKETSGKAGAKQLVSSARHRTCTSVAGGQEVPFQAQCDGFAVSARLFLIPRLKNIQKGH
jgi:hypothetical protein